MPVTKTPKIPNMLGQRNENINFLMKILENRETKNNFNGWEYRVLLFRSRSRLWPPSSLHRVVIETRNFNDLPKITLERFHVWYQAENTENSPQFESHGKLMWKITQVDMCCILSFVTEKDLALRICSILFIVRKEWYERTLRWEQENDSATLTLEDSLYFISHLILCNEHLWSEMERDPYHISFNFQVPL